APVHALLIRDGRLRAQSGFLHDEFLGVALRARLRNVGVIRSRFRIGGGKNLVGGAVTILAARTSDACTLGVQAVVPRGDGVGVARCTIDSLRLRLVWNRRRIGVAIDAAEGRMDRAGEFLRVDG